MFTIFPWSFNVTVKSQNEVPIFSLFQSWKWLFYSSLSTECSYMVFEGFQIEFHADLKN